MIAREDTLAQEDIKNGRLTGRVVGYELGKLLEPDAVVLNDGLSRGVRRDGGLEDGRPDRSWLQL